MNRKFNNSLDFVVKHYRKNAFPTAGVFRKRKSFRTRWIAAASVAAAITASACIYFLTDTPQPEEQPELTRPYIEDVPAPTANEVKRLEFHDAPLDIVVAEIEKEYGVEITNVPDSAEHLTLSYEGTASDIVATINEILGIDMKIKK